MRILARVVIILCALFFINCNYPVLAANNKTVTNNTRVESTKKTVKKVTKKKKKKLTKKQKAKLKAKKEKQKGKQIVKTASLYVGKLPYVSGGASLQTGSDCCGFTMCIYAKNKIKIGRTVEMQAQQGHSVSLSKALPGDIVVYWGHVGIYIGDYKVIHCPQPGEYVKVSYIYMMNVYDIRRIR